MALARHQDAGHNGEEKLTLKARAFLGQCPLILLVALLVVWRLPTPASPAAPAAPARQVADCKHSRFSRIDVLGSITLLCTISLTLLILDMGGKQMSFTSPAMVGLICTTTGTAAAFVLIEAYWANEPVFPLRLAANRGVASAYTMAALQLAAEYGVVFTVPLYFQITQTATALAAGTRLLPGLVAYAAGGLLAGAVIARTGRYKALSLAGPIFSCFGYIVLSYTWHGKSNLFESFFIIPGDLGSGMTQSAAFIAFSAATDKADMAVAVTGYSVCQQIGVTMGTSTTMAVLQGQLKNTLTHLLKDVPEADSIIKRSMSDIGYIQSLTGRLRSDVAIAYIGSFRYTYILSAGLAMCAAAIACSVKELKV